MLFLICSEIIVLQLAKIEHFAQIYHPLGKKSCRGRGGDWYYRFAREGQMAYRVIVQPSIMPL